MSAYSIIYSRVLYLNLQKKRPKLVVVKLFYLGTNAEVERDYLLGISKSMVSIVPKMFLNSFGILIWFSVACKRPGDVEGCGE